MVGSLSLSQLFDSSTVGSLILFEDGHPIQYIGLPFCSRFVGSNLLKVESGSWVVPQDDVGVLLVHLGLGGHASEDDIAVVDGIVVRPVNKIN
jgi:hypothetical protein